MVNFGFLLLQKYFLKMSIIYDNYHENSIRINKYGPKSVRGEVATIQ